MGKHESFESFKPFKGNVRATEEEAERKKLDFHNRDLHDEMPDERIDEATGKLLKPTSDIEEAHANLDVIEVGAHDASEDVLGALPEEDDAAAKWLRELAQKQKEEGEGKEFKKAA